MNSSNEIESNSSNLNLFKKKTCSNQKKTLRRLQAKPLEDLRNMKKYYFTFELFYSKFHLLCNRTIDLSYI